MDIILPPNQQKQLSSYIGPESIPDHSVSQMLGQCIRELTLEGIYNQT